MVRFVSVLSAGLLVSALSNAAPLLVSDLLTQVRTVVYEIPEGPDRAEVVRAIKAWNRVSPQTEIVDAGSLSDEALRRKIKGTFVCYTILSEEPRLLRLLAQPLPLRIEKGSLHWGDLASAAKDLRVVFVGANPYAAGYSVVYAAGSTSLLKQGFEAVRMIDTNRSYHIDKDGDLLREGTYDRNFSFGTRPAPPPAAEKPTLLTPGVVLSPGFQVVYEVGAQDKAEFRRDLEKELPPGTEILDADDAALKAKIKTNFMLLTLLSEESRLLRLTAAPLPLRVENGTLHWQDMSVPIKDNLYIHFMGKNPYSNGYTLVIAVGSLDSHGEVNNLSPSFGIRKGKTLLREGFYDQSFSFKGRPSVTLAEATEDLDQFFSTLERAHPDLFRRVSKKEYEQLKQQVRRDVAAQAGEQGRIPREDLGYILRYAAAFIKDGHTEVWSFPTVSRSRKTFPPFWLKAENGRYLIADAVDDSLRNAEILAVNGVPIGKFLKPALDHISGETSTWTAALFVRDQSTWFSLPSLGGETFALKLREERGVERQQTVRAVRSNKFEKLRPEEESRPETHVEFIEPGGIARLVYPAFAPGDEEKKKIDEIFGQIKKRKTTDLIIDLRGNGGGETSMQGYIFKYLYGGKFRNVAKARDKMSRENVSAHQGKSISPFLGRLLVSPAVPAAGEGEIRRMLAREGRVITTSIKESKHPKPDSFFTGRTYLLIDNRTFSAATTFSAMFRDYRVGEILGQETGGTPTMFGAADSFTLNNSQIGGRVSCSEYFAARPKRGDDEHGVLPDIPIGGKALAPFRSEADPMLAFTLAHIRKTHGSPVH